MIIFKLTLAIFQKSKIDFPAVSIFTLIIKSFWRRMRLLRKMMKLRRRLWSTWTTKKWPWTTTSQVWLNCFNIFINLLFVKKSFIWLEGKSMTHHRGECCSHSFLPATFSCQSRTHPWSAFWDDTASFKGPQPCLMHCLWTYRETRTQSGVGRLAHSRTQEIV